MKQYSAAVVAILAGSLFSIQSIAEEYDYEVGVSYGNNSVDFETPEVIVGGRHLAKLRAPPTQTRSK